MVSKSLTLKHSTVQKSQISERTVLSSRKKMIARLALFLFLSIGCVRGTSLRENMTRLSATEGIIIAGGFGGLADVEVFVPSTGLSCSLPALPDERYGHTMDSLLICGGYDSATGTTCLSFTSDKWITSHTLVDAIRELHTSWQTEQGLVLMGGQARPTTSEIVATGGGQGGPAFAMQYETTAACSMPDLTSDSVIITGGYYPTSSTVSRYGVLGWVEDLPSLVVGRWNHGCGSYLRGDGTQVLLVAGGVDEYYNYLSSTEVLTMDSPGWTLTTPLPQTLTRVKGVNVSGRLYITGGRDHNGYVRDEILGWLHDEQEWEETGKMKMGRYNHAVSTIQMDDQAMEHCS